MSCYSFKCGNHNCSRVITGKRRLRQTIYVEGVGSKKDSAIYSDNHHPVDTMEPVAKLIALEIIQTNDTSGI